MWVPGHQQREQDIDISNRLHAPDFKTSSCSKRVAISALVIAGTRGAAPIATGGSTIRRTAGDPPSNARSKASVKFPQRDPPLRRRQLGTMEKRIREKSVVRPRRG
jgi:hypothetical protein